MTSRIITTEHDREMLFSFLKENSLPFTVTITKGRKRSVEQNALQRKWTQEIAEQLGDQKPEEIRAYNKLTIGVPILREENDGFREKYDKIIKPLPYEYKMNMMAEPLDFPVTRLMTMKQKKRYLDELVRHWSEKGILLTMPESS